MPGFAPLLMRLWQNAFEPGSASHAPLSKPHAMVLHIRSHVLSRVSSTLHPSSQYVYVGHAMSGVFPCTVFCRCERRERDVSAKG